MKTTRSYQLATAMLVFSTLGVVSARAVDRVWTPTSGDSFTEDANWNPAGAPAGADQAIFEDPSVTAVLNFTGNRQLGSFQMGTAGATGGSMHFSGGELTVLGTNTSYIGDEGSLNSTLVMSGNAVMLYDGPLGSGGAGLGGNGGGKDLEIGAQSGGAGAVGRLEVHDNAILRIGDDLKIGAEANGNGEVLIDGNAVVSAGSGVSVSEQDGSAGKLTIAGNGLLVSGNSAGAGNTAEGYTDEGYLTLTVRADGTADVLIKESGKLYSRNLQHRAGNSNITIEDNGEFHVFDTYRFAGPDLGVATIGGDPFANFARAANAAENAGSVFNLSLSDNAVMTVDSALDDGTGLLFQGLALSGGNNLGQITGTGGSSFVNIQDSATFVVQQNLYMTAASSDLPVGAESVLRITGPDATVQVHGDLYMSHDPFVDLPNADPSTIAAVITDSAHSTIEVGGLANIGAGNLAVELAGYSPIGGESFTLLTAGSIVGSSFLNTDFSLAPLASGLSWDLQVGGNSIVLNVLGSIAGDPGDFDKDGDVDGIDFLLWQRGGSPDPHSASDLADWRNNYGSGSSLASATAVPEPSCLILLLGVAVVAGSRGRKGRS